jgi:2-polyprenyl-3-methyl-5-hydroxy-6-metoxy-1,4-benzoquinol methylase
MNPPNISPEPILQALTGYWVSGALKTALDLDLFSTIASGARETPEIAKRLGTPERSTAMLCDALVGVGFLGKDGSRYALTAITDTFLVKDKPTYFGALSNIVTNRVLWDRFGDLEAAVRKDGAVGGEPITPDMEFWETFAQSSLPLAMSQGQVLAEALSQAGLSRGAKVLDVACGTGGYGVAYAMRDPSARVTQVDGEKVLVHSRRIAEQFGVARQIEQRPGDFFQIDLGRDYDAVIAANFHHHFDFATCVELNRRLRAALKPGGVAVAVDFVPDEERKQATMPLLFSLVMLVQTPSGTTYTLNEYRRMFAEAGFRAVELRPGPGVQSFIFAR